MAEWHRRRDARFAWIDHAAVFGRQRAKVEKVALTLGVVADDRFGEFRETKRLRHFAGARLVGASARIDQENPAFGRRLVVPSLRVADGIACREPFQRQLVLGICELTARLPSAGTLSIFVIAVPRNVADALQLVANALEGGIVESCVETFVECFGVDARVGLALSDLRRFVVRHCSGRWSRPEVSAGTTPGGSNGTAATCGLLRSSSPFSETVG